MGLRIGGVAEIAFDAERTGIAAHDLDQILSLIHISKDVAATLDGSAVRAKA